MRRLLICCVLLVSHESFSIAREVTHEDIRDAMLSLVNLLRQADDKLERHEAREKALGEQLKKAVAALDRRQKTFDPFKGMMTRLEERLSNVETILIQKDEKEKKDTQKTAEMLSSLESKLQNWSTSIPKMVHNEISGIKIPVYDTSNIEARLAALEKNMIKRLDDVSHSIEGVKQSIKDKPNTVECKKPAANEDVLSRQMAETEKLLHRYEVKLTEYNANMTKIQTEIVPLSEISLADEAWHGKMTAVLESQQKELQEIKKSLQNTEEALKAIPRQADVDSVRREVNQSLQNIHSAVLSQQGNDVGKLDSQLSELKERCQQLESVILNRIQTSDTKEDILYTEILKSYEQLSAEVQSLSKVEMVMIQTADNVLDTKRRIEYGVQQILQEVGGLIHIQGKDMNVTFNERLNEMEDTIISNQNVAFANLSSKVEVEISQVWRQIAIMHTQLTASTTALEELQGQTELYVNGTVSTMDNVKGKVGLITNRMAEVDSNLNYLLGRLSLVTQEFNQIKKGLGDALDNIKSSFQTVQAKIKETGPGPHKIPDENTRK